MQGSEVPDLSILSIIFVEKLLFDTSPLSLGLFSLNESNHLTPEIYHLGQYIP